MKSSPIYNIIHASGRRSDPSFGCRGFSQDIRVGTSASNSHTLARISVERHANDDDTVDFTLYLDGSPVKRGRLNGKAFTLAFTP